MSSPSGGKFARVAVAFAIAVAMAIGSSAGSVAAASITFGTPTASSSFGKGVTFRQPFSSGATFREVDIAITDPRSFGPAVVRIGTPGVSSFTYVLDALNANLRPNTQLVARFEVTLADGTVENGTEIRVTYQDDRFKWKTKVGTIVRLHWYDGDEAFAQQALQMGEKGISDAATFLGFKETAPVDFYVYSDQSSFYDALGPDARDNVGGRAIPETRTLFALIAPGDISYASTVVPHELTHVVFGDIVRNPYHQPVNWLNEGIAVYVSQGFDSSDKQLVEQAAADGSLMPLSAIRGMFPTTQDRFFLAYAEAVSAVDYFMRTYGHDDLVKLVKAFGTGASDDEAFTAAIGLGVDGFDAAWMKANGVTALRSFGPLPAPTGPETANSTSGSSGGSSNSLPVVPLLAAAAVLVGLLLVVVLMSRRARSRGAS